MIGRAHAIATLAALLTGLAPGAGIAREVAAAPVRAPADHDWRQLATAADRVRLRDWRAAFERGLAQARAASDGAIARDTALFDPDAALATALPPPGNYRCRTIKLGSKIAELRYIAYPWFTCRIGPGPERTFTKVGGSQRVFGALYADNDLRGVLLGTLVLGDERTPLDYGQDGARDMAGVVERIGADRWRIVLPSPAYESLVDLIELRPAGG